MPFLFKREVRDVQSTVGYLLIILTLYCEQEKMVPNDNRIIEATTIQAMIVLNILLVGVIWRFSQIMSEGSDAC